MRSLFWFMTGAAASFFTILLIATMSNWNQGVQREKVCIEAKAKGYALEQCAFTVGS